MPNIEFKLNSIKMIIIGISNGIPSVAMRAPERLVWLTIADIKLNIILNKDAPNTHVIKKRVWSSTGSFLNNTKKPYVNMISINNKRQWYIQRAIHIFLPDEVVYKYSFWDMVLCKKLLVIIPIEENKTMIQKRAFQLFMLNLLKLRWITIIVNKIKKTFDWSMVLFLQSSLNSNLKL